MKETPVIGLYLLTSIKSKTTKEIKETAKISFGLSFSLKNNTFGKAKNLFFSFNR